MRKMRRNSLLYLFCLLLMNGWLTAQVEERRTESESSSFQVRELVNDQNAISALSGGTGAFYVANPGPGYKVDVELAYLTTDYRPAQVQLLTGERFAAPVRYRIIDQTFEVAVDGQAYNLDPGRLRSVRQDSQLFRQMTDVLYPKSGRTVYQQHYADAEYQVLEQHLSLWQDPPPKNMFDTQEQFRTLRRTSRVILVRGGQPFEIKRTRDVYKLLNIPKKGKTAKFIQERQLDLRQAADVALLLSKLAEQ